MGQILSCVWKCLTSKFKNEIANKSPVADPFDDHSVVVTIIRDDENRQVSSSNPENVRDVDVVDKKEVISNKEEKSGISSSSSNSIIKWINGEYSSMHSILLVGEGDFSFSASLAFAFASASNIVATSLDSHEFLIQNYKFFKNNKMKIESRGGLVMHGVNARRMSKDALLSTVKFDRIIFNFPHTGDFGRTELDLRKNKELVRGFLRSAKRMIVKDGEIHIRHKTNGYFHLWNIANIGSDEGLFLIQNPVFYRHKYPGYHTKFGFRGNKDFDCTPSRTYKFGLRPKLLIEN